MTCYNANDLRFRAESDSATIQNAINATREGACRAVVIPRYNERTGESRWVIDKTLLLPNDITVYLDDCFLTLADGVYENIFRNELALTEAALELENEQHGIRIIGLGNAILDGGKDNGLREQRWTPDQPMPITGCLVMLHNVREYALENFKCQRMRYWAINHVACRKGRIRDIDFDFVERHPNQDGINFRLGCSEITVENITGVTGFVGPGSRPTPLSEEEVEALNIEHTRVELSFKVGDAVSVIEGLFAGYSGTVQSISDDLKKVTVLVKRGARDLPVELDTSVVKLS